MQKQIQPLPRVNPLKDSFPYSEKPTQKELEAERLIEDELEYNGRKITSSPILFVTY